MGTCGTKIKQHIIEHEILGIDGGGSITDIQVDGGRLWVYDSSRSKWLSSDRLTASAGRAGRAKNSYLRLHDGQTSNLTGYRLPRDATITAMMAQTRNVETWTLRVRKNGSATNVASLVLNGVDGRHVITTNVDLDEGDQVQFYADTTEILGIRDPFVWIEIAWRNTNL